MDLLIIGDNHGDIENNLNYFEKLSNFKFDVIVYTGDFTDINTPKGFTPEDIVQIILEGLRGLKKPILAIPGNNDVVGVINILEREGVSLHGRGKVIGDYGFYGFGGAKTPFKTPLEPSEEEIKNGLQKAFGDISGSKEQIQITHNPAYGTRMDVIRMGSHVGSNVVKEFIEEKKPVLAISAHIHEAKGIDRIGNTFLINVGKFSEGYFGLANIEGKVVEGCVMNLIE